MPSALIFDSEHFKKQFEILFKRLMVKDRTDVIFKSLKAGGLVVAGWSRTNRLSGPRPKFLGVVTNRLRSSITVSAPQQEGNAYFAKIGTNVKYAGIHERGFVGPVSVPGHTRKTKRGFSFVRAHTRQLNYAGKPFLRPAVENRGNQIEFFNILVENINKMIGEK